MNSAIYTGILGHARSRPIPHEFHYPAVLFYLDLDELDSLARSLRLFGVNGRNVVAFHDADHWDGKPGATRPKLERFARANGIDLDGGKIFLLTQCRVLGYVFNPVSFYYCHDSGGSLRAIVAEVNNTFGERHCYWLDERTREAAPDPSGVEGHRAVKRMHVSPFISMDAVYAFRFAPVGERLSVHISESEHGEHFFDAHLSGRRRRLDDRGIAAMLVGRPVSTLRVTAAIHWQAFRLWRRGVPFHRKPKPSAEQMTQARLFEQLAEERGS
jgi:DUF1365 family protein